MTAPGFPLTHYCQFWARLTVERVSARRFRLAGSELTFRVDTLRLHGQAKDALEQSAPGDRLLLSGYPRLDDAGAIALLQALTVHPAEEGAGLINTVQLQGKSKGKGDRPRVWIKPKSESIKDFFVPVPAGLVSAPGIWQLIGAIAQDGCIQWHHAHLAVPERPKPPKKRAKPVESQPQTASGKPAPAVLSRGKHKVEIR